MKIPLSHSLCPWLFEPLTMLATAADAGRLGHGWLISGPRGIGKSNLAYALAAHLLGQQAGTQLPVASPRTIVTAYDELAQPQPMDLHADLHRVRAEEDKHTIAVEQVRDMSFELALTPHLAGAKVVILEAADTMTVGATNALLKSLEEPTPNTYLFLLAERPGRLAATIRSRCQHLALKGPGLSAAREWLAMDGIESAGLPPGMLRRRPITAARLALDPDNFLQYKQLQDNIRLLLEGESDPHEFAEAWAKNDPDLALSSLIERLRNSIRARLVPGHSNLVTDPGDRLAENSSRRIGVDALFAGLEMAENLRDQLGRGANVELALKSILVGLERGDARRLYS